MKSKLLLIVTLILICLITISAFATSKNFNAKDVLTSDQYEKYENNGVIFSPIELYSKDGNTILEGCFSFPSVNDWFPSITANLNGKEYYPLMFEVLGYKENPSVFSSYDRCQAIIFPFESKNGETVQFNISNIYYDLFFLDPNSSDLSILKNSLQKEYPGLDFDIVVSQEGNGGGANLVITKNPNKISEEEFFKAIDKYGTIYHSTTIQFEMAK